MKKYTELFTIPLGFMFYYLFGYLAELKGWHVYGTGVFQKLFLGFVLFLIVIGLARLIFSLTFPALFRYIDDDFKENKSWECLQPHERTWAALLLLCVYSLIFALLVANL